MVCFRVWETELGEALLAPRVTAVRGPVGPVVQLPADAGTESRRITETSRLSSDT